MRSRTLICIGMAAAVSATAVPVASAIEVDPIPTPVDFGDFRCFSATVANPFANVINGEMTLLGEFSQTASLPASHDASRQSVLPPNVS